MMSCGAAKQSWLRSGDMTILAHDALGSEKATLMLVERRCHCRPMGAGGAAKQSWFRLSNITILAHGELGSGKAKLVSVEHDYSRP